MNLPIMPLALVIGAGTSSTWRAKVSAARKFVRRTLFVFSARQRNSIVCINVMNPAAPDLLQCRVGQFLEFGEESLYFPNAEYRHYLALP